MSCDCDTPLDECQHSDTGRQLRESDDEILCARCGRPARCNHCSTGIEILRTARAVHFNCALCGETIQTHRNTDDAPKGEQSALW